MIEKVINCNIKREEGHLYHIDEKGKVIDINKSKRTASVILLTGLKKNKKMYYFLDQKGEVSKISKNEIDSHPEIKEEIRQVLIFYGEPHSYNEDGSNEVGEREMLEEEEREKLNEERRKLNEKQVKSEIRKKLLEKEFKDLPKGSDRERIPEDVRITVWRRDNGKCVKCSSRKNLEYDHIIPISKGGSNTVRNIELLCEKCNREKRDNIQ